MNTLPRHNKGWTTSIASHTVSRKDTRNHQEEACLFTDLVFKAFTCLWKFEHEASPSLIIFLPSWLVVFLFPCLVAFPGFPHIPAFPSHPLTLPHCVVRVIPSLVPRLKLISPHRSSFLSSVCLTVCRSLSVCLTVCRSLWLSLSTCLSL